MTHTRRYFDNAATSYPKPPAVACAVQNYMTRLGAPARGSYREALRAGEIVERCRDRINTLINAGGPQRVVFCSNATDALNLAIKGVLRAALTTRKGPVRVVTTTTEHNSVLRPLKTVAAEHTRLSIDYVPCDPLTGMVDAGAVLRAVQRTSPDLLVVCHASNVTGAIQPVEEIGVAVKSSRPGTIYLIDAAQSIGRVPIDMRRCCADMLAFPGHKALLGPQGTGGLAFAEGAERSIPTLKEGGTGARSELEFHPQELPEKFEPGSHNVAGIAGLLAAMEWLVAQKQGTATGVDAIRFRELRLIERLIDGLSQIGGLTLFGPRDAAKRIGVFSFTHRTVPPQEIARRLECDHGIVARAGLHCAPLMHTAIGTYRPVRRTARSASASARSSRSQTQPRPSPQSRAPATRCECPRSRRPSPQLLAKRQNAASRRRCLRERHVNSDVDRQRRDVYTRWKTVCVRSTSPPSGNMCVLCACISSSNRCSSSIDRHLSGIPSLPDIGSVHTCSSASTSFASSTISR
ncbi:MAG: aminotransferase class V-fold PLP-dependent enzyme [Phycisphaerales bacterium]